MRARTALFLLCLLATASPALAQPGGAVSGRVVDQTGAPLAGVTVELTSETSSVSALTDERGAYRFEPVRAGAVELTFRLVNFTVVRRAATVASGRVETVDALLALSLSADVIVTLAACLEEST